MIESVNNERVKNWTKLQDKKYRDEEHKFIVEGEHLVEEAAKAGLLEEVIALDGYTFDYENITYVSEPVMKKITALTSTPRIIGIASMIKPRGIEGNVLLLDAVQDPGNLGTIIRSAIAFNIDTLIIGNNSVNMYNPKVVRATEGLIFHLNIIEGDLIPIIKDLKSKGYTIYSTDVEEGISTREIEFSSKTGIIVGNEGSGVSKNISAYADKKLYIPMNEMCESLNVGVATSIILYELNK